MITTIKDLIKNNIFCLSAYQTMSAMSVCVCVCVCREKGGGGWWWVRGFIWGGGVVMN